MEMGAFTGALVALLAKDMASAIASEMGKDVSGAAKQALRRLRQRLRREPDTRAAMEQLETNPSDPATQERLAEQLTGKLKCPVSSNLARQQPADLRRARFAEKKTSWLSH
jgi:putative heme iron utilization protein